MSREIVGSTVLITGGTGSFGSTMARHLLQRNVEEVRILSRDEAKQDAMRHALGDSRVKFYLGDTRDPESVEGAVRGSNLIFHAAALKQVPSAEFFPLEAVKTNINGSANVLRSAIENDVGGVVCLSTDKAVYPINAMGMSKALMEKIAISKSKNLSQIQTQVTVTRYGNVLFSRGSILPLLINKINKNEPITITDFNMTRFLMTLDSAIDLVLFALKFGKNGQIIIPETYATTIKTLSDAVLKIFKKENYPIKIIGTRHGEK